jgi:hypothetical protein
MRLDQLEWKVSTVPGMSAFARVGCRILYRMENGYYYREYNFGAYPGPQMDPIEAQCWVYEQLKQCA